MNKSLTVRQLNMYVKSLIEGDPKLVRVVVSGEISNFKNHYSSGHLYFTLKDKDAQIRCVMFRSFASRIKITPKDGMLVVLVGRVSIYEKDGQYQFYAEEMNELGVGDIKEKFEMVKAKLKSEGLFDVSNKRQIPKFPKKIAVITSDTGAAVKDIINIISRRYKIAEIILCPVIVQGDFAVSSMIDTLKRVYLLNDIDVIIIGRGGGSAEDLWCFNDEELARIIYESPFPVVSAVGHETDFTICDFVSDLRAPTPSAAAELVTPDINDILLNIESYEKALKNALVNQYNYNNARLNSLINSRYFKNADDSIVNIRMQYIDRIVDKMAFSYERTVKTKENEFQKLLTGLDSLSPLKVLARGYSLTQKEGKTVNSVKDIEIGDVIKQRFTDGEIISRVTNRRDIDG